MKGCWRRAGSRRSPRPSSPSVSSPSSCRACRLRTSPRGSPPPRPAGSPRAVVIALSTFWPAGAALGLDPAAARPGAMVPRVSRDRHRLRRQHGPAGPGRRNPSAGDPGARAGPALPRPARLDRLRAHPRRHVAALLSRTRPGRGPAGGAVGSLSSSRLRWVVAAIAAVAVGVALFAVLWRDATERLLDRLFVAAARTAASGRAPDRPHVPRRFRVPQDAPPGAPGPRRARSVMWFVINVQIYCVTRAFGLDLPLSAAYVVTTAAVLGLAVPTPGGVGGYHAAVQFALTDVFRVPRRHGHRRRPRRACRLFRADLAHRLRALRHESLAQARV